MSILHHVGKKGNGRHDIRSWKKRRPKNRKFRRHHIAKQVNGMHGIRIKDKYKAQKRDEVREKNEWLK